MHQLFGEFNLEVIAVAADAGLVGRSGLDADKGRFRLAEQLQMAERIAAEGLSVDGCIAVEEPREYAQLVTRIVGSEVVHLVMVVAQGNANG